MIRSAALGFVCSCLALGCGDDGLTTGETGTIGDASTTTQSSAASMSTTGATETGETTGEDLACKAKRAAVDAVAEAYVAAEALVGLSISVETEGCDPWSRTLMSMPTLPRPSPVAAPARQAPSPGEVVARTVVSSPAGRRQPVGNSDESGQQTCPEDLGSWARMAS